MAGHRDHQLTRLYTGGTFDLFHQGHVEFLRKCKEISTEVVVALNKDEFVSRFKRPPVMSYDERKACLEACKYVDRVIPNTGNEDSKMTITLVDPSIIAIGSDWANKDYYKQMGFDQGWLRQHGITLVYIDYHQGISTTEILERIKNR